MTPRDAPHAVDLPLIAQQTYSELLERTSQRSVDAASAEAGTFSVKTVKGRRYWYFQPARRTAGTAAPSQRYVGLETKELVQRITRHREAKREQNAQRAMVRALVQGYGLPAPLPVVANVIEGLARSGVFRSRAVLIDTLAYQTYPALLGTRLRDATVQRSDGDVARFLGVSIAMQDEPEFMTEVLQAIDPTFRKIPPLPRNATVQYLSRNQLRVDFLPVDLTPSHTGAEALRHLNYLIHEPVEAVLLQGSGIAVTVPAPERFAVHQLIESRRRKSRPAESEKALQQAATLLRVLLSKRPEDLKRVWHEAMQHGPAWRDLLRAAVGKLPASVNHDLKALGVFPRFRS